MDPNFQSRYLESTDEPAEAVDPLAEPHMPPTPTLGEPVGLDPAPYRPEDQYTEVLPPVTAPGTPPRHAVADAAGPRTGPQAAARPAQPAAASQWGARPAAAQPAAVTRTPAVRPQRDWTPSPAGGSARTSTFQPGSAVLRVEDVAQPRKMPPEMGWRKTVYVGSGKLVNLGAGPAELELRANIDAITANIPGNYTIAVVSMKGGVGKTRVTAGLGTVYANYRTEPVISLDANPTYGNLGRLVDPSATATVREFMSDDQVTTYPMARSYTGKNRQGLEVLPGNQNVANPMVLTDDLFNAVIARARQFYQLALIDCGPHIEHRVMRSVLSQADALVIVGTMGFDGAAAAETTLDWLDARNSHELLRRSVVVLNDVHDNADSEFLSTVEKSLAPRVGAVKTIPFDKHLRDSHTLDFTALQKRTRLAFIDLAAWLAKGFTGNVGVR